MRTASVVADDRDTAKLEAGPVTCGGWTVFGLARTSVEVTGTVWAATDAEQLGASENVTRNGDDWVTVPDIGVVAVSVHPAGAAGVAMVAVADAVAAMLIPLSVHVTRPLEVTAMVDEAGAHDIEKSLAAIARCAVMFDV